MTSHVHGNDLKKHIFCLVKFCITEVLDGAPWFFFSTFKSSRFLLSVYFAGLVLGNSTEVENPTVRCLTMLWREAAWSKYVSHSLRCLNSRVTSKTRTNKIQENQFGRLYGNGAMAPAETLSSVPGGPYTVFFGKKSCPVISQEFQIGVATPWLPWLA